MLTFECQVTGVGSTVWTGTAFMCTSGRRNEIILLHSPFNESTKVNGTCSNGSIVAEFIEVNGNNCTSQLNVTFNSFLIGKTVVCVHDDGTNTSVVANYTITSRDKPRLHALIRITLNRVGMRVSAVHTRNHELD